MSPEFVEFLLALIVTLLSLLVGAYYKGWNTGWKERTEFANRSEANLLAEIKRLKNGD